MASKLVQEYLDLGFSLEDATKAAKKQKSAMDKLGNASERAANKIKNAS